MTKIHLTRRRLALIAVFVILVLGLAILLRDFVRQSILQPLIDFGWLVWVELLTVPQIVFWGLFVVLALFITLRSLTGGSSNNFAGFAIRANPRYTQSSRYHHWKINLDAMPGSPFALERVERELQTLVLQILADHARVDVDEIRNRQKHGLIDLSTESPAVQALFSINRHDYFPVQSAGLIAWLSRLLRRTPAPLPSEETRLDVEEIVRWMEIQTGQRDPLAHASSEKRDASDKLPA